MFLLLLSSLLIVSCGDNTSKTTSSTLPESTVSPVKTSSDTLWATLPSAVSTPSPVTTKPIVVTAPMSTDMKTTVPVTTKTPISETEPQVTTVLQTTPGTTIPETTVPETSAAPITYTAKSWMGALPDATFLNNIAIPGTHDSGATKDMILAGTAKCQSLSIAEQLAVGVRFFDIRLRRVDGELHVYHGYVDQELTFDEVLSACYTFLAENPSEALIMCIKEEYDASGTNSAFDAMVAAKIKENAAYWHTTPAVPTLGAVRGKIVLMRRYSTSGSFGINASSGWRDNTTFTLNTGSATLSVQDYYNNESADAKWAAVTAMFQKMQYKKNTYYLNYTSGYKAGTFDIPNINTIKDSVNPKLIEYLKTSPDFVGTVVVDFVTDEIAQLIYEVNFR